MLVYAPLVLLFLFISSFFLLRFYTIGMERRNCDSSHPSRQSPNSSKHFGKQKKMLSIRPNLISSRSAIGTFSFSSSSTGKRQRRSTLKLFLSSSSSSSSSYSSFCRHSVKRGEKTSSSLSSSSSSSNIHTVRQRFPICTAYNNNSNFSNYEDEEDFDEPVPGPGGRIESDAIKRNVRDSVINAIDQSRSRRVTAGDVASSSGIQLFDATQALTALAADTNASLEVTNDGDLVYAFPSGYKQLLQAKSFKLKTEPAVDKVKEFLSYLVRVSFGTTLVASVVIVYTTIFALLSSQKDDRNDRRSNRGGGMMYFGPRFYPGDIFWYLDPYYYRRPYRLRAKDEMNFFEAVFSFVFGDGDPNNDFERERWVLIGQTIAKNGGVVTAEQLAPFLDREVSAELSDESFVLPVLTRFQGSPEMDDSGNIFYRFPAAQVTALEKKQQNRLKRNSGSSTNGLAKEERWSFSLADPSQKFMSAALGVVNFVGVIWLSSLMSDPQVLYRNAELVQSIGGFLPALQVYAALFFAIPILRNFRIGIKNKQIDQRNTVRLQSLLRLERPDEKLRRKLTEAKSKASRKFVSEVDSIFSSSGKGQKDSSALELEAFDRRLNKED